MKLQPISSHSQRGVASLIVVMVLFFIVSLMAAYTSRNLIFEQKTSANQARNTAAFEAADAGVEWTVAQLNGGVVGAACLSGTPTNSFQQRYLDIPAATGLIDHAVRAGSWPTCVFNGAAWECTCPEAAVANPAAPTGSHGPGPYPAFRVWLATNEPTTSAATPMDVLAGAAVPSRPGVLWMSSVGCTRLPSAGGCLDYLPQSEVGEGMAAMRVMLALRSGLATPPAVAVTAREEVRPAGAGAAPKLRVVNSDTRSAGLTVNSGANIDRNLFAAESLPGTPGEMSLVEKDVRLRDFTNVAPATTPPAAAALTAGERMFVSIFGMKRATYQEQPGLRICASPCSASTINDLLAANPNRIIWAEGNVTVDQPIGVNPGAPVLLIVNGDTLTLTAGNPIYGFVYMTGGASPTSTINLPDAPTSIVGAIVAEGSLFTSYSGAPAPGSELTVTYDRAALDRLRTSYGSWVRLGGGWRDFKANP